MLGSRVRWSLASVGLCSLALLAGCSEGVSGPGDKPQLIVVQSVTNVAWDFTGLIGTASGTQDWGTSKTISNGANGSMVASTLGTITHVTSKGLELPVGNTERGLGLCYIISPSTACTGDEVGDDNRLNPAPFSSLFLNLNGVLPAGSTLTQIDLGSVQLAEGWQIYKSTTGPGGPFTLLSSGEGNNVNNVGDNVTITTGLPLPTANLVLRFDKNTAASGNATTDNDYVVKSVTTSFESGGGCTFTQGYWKNHPEAWPVTSLTLGTVTYTQAQLLAILNQPVQGNGLVSLARQLIAAKLNIANGASPTPSAIASADALIGSKVVPPIGNGFIAPATSSSLNSALNDFNTGVTGPGHCEEEVL